MASTNAAGARSLRYGATRPWVMALDCIFDDGSRATVRRGEPPAMEIPAIARFVRDVLPRLAGAGELDRPGVLKESSGYALAQLARSGEIIDLLVGSEGTLALFAGIELALAELPGATSGLLAAFPSLEAAVDGALLARASGASACELLDRTFLEIATAGGKPLPVAKSSEAVLIAEVEGATRDDAAAAARNLQVAFDRVGASSVHVAVTAEDERALWVFRHAASPALTQLHPSLASMQFIEDGAVPPERLPEYVRGVRAALARQEIRGVIFGHAGDANVHVNPLIDLRRSDWRENITGVLDEVTELVASLGGTLTGEHGDGRIRTPLMDRVWTPEAMACFAEVKQALDPAAILNPAVKIPSGEHSLNDIKYDPAIPPLQAQARAALDHIERHRAYSTFRLSLIDDG
jgi:FAD/FMN-containing dehydrogenase